MISKSIFTTWFDENGYMPELIRRCIESQKIPGYDHKIITLDDLPKNNKYINEALNSPLKQKRMCKLSDYVRIHTLYNEGGIYLDADVEMIPGKNFDELLVNKSFAGKDHLDWVGTAIQASEKHNPFYKTWLEHLETNFRGDDDKISLSSFSYFTDLVKEDPNCTTVLSPDYFYPYEFRHKTINITRNTIAIHHFLRSWF